MRVVVLQYTTHVLSNLPPLDTPHDGLGPTESKDWKLTVFTAPQIRSLHRPLNETFNPQTYPRYLNVTAVFGVMPAARSSHPYFKFIIHS